MNIFGYKILLNVYDLILQMDEKAMLKMLKRLNIDSNLIPHIKIGPPSEER